MKKKVKENIYNIPNKITTIRVLITLSIIYLVFAGYSILTISLVFIIGMLTDAADGMTARRLKQKTEFGRKYDMIADRFLFAATLISVVIYYTNIGYLTGYELLQIGMIISREIIDLPIVIYNLFKGKLTPHVKTIGKIMTVFQAVSFPLIILKFEYSIYLAVITGIIGVFAAIAYIRDSV